MGCFCIRKSFAAVSSNQRGSGFSASQDGSSAVEDGKKEKGLLLGAEKDDSGSVLEFHLIPQSGMHSLCPFLFPVSCFIPIFSFSSNGVELEFLPLFYCQHEVALA